MTRGEGALETKCKQKGLEGAVMGGGGCVLLSRFARPRRSACFALIFLGPSHSKSRKEGVSSDSGRVLRCGTLGGICGLLISEALGWPPGCVCPFSYASGHDLQKVT